MALSPLVDNDTPTVASVTPIHEEPDPVVESVTPMVSPTPKKATAQTEPDPVIASVTPMVDAHAIPNIAPSGTVVKSGHDFPLVDRSTWEPRADGSPKGDGYFGLLTRPDGRVSSEISIGTTDVTPGQEMEIPLLVPTLTAQEVQTLLKADLSKPDGMPPAIVAKAVDFARQRVAAGKSPFAQSGEQQAPPKPIQAPQAQRDAAALLLHGGGRGTGLDVRKSENNIISEGAGQTAQGARELYGAATEPFKAVTRIVTGATSPAGVLSSGARASEASARLAAAPAQAMAGVNDLLEGAGKLATPAVVAAAIADPLTTIPTIALVTGLSNGAEATATAMGASHETARFVGNLVGAAIATGGIAEHVTGATRAKITDFLKSEPTPAETADAMKTLGVDYTSAVDPEALKSAFRKESMATHPDRNPNDPAAADKFMAVKAAYEWLIDNPPPQPSAAAKWKATLTKGVEDLLSWRPKAAAAASSAETPAPPSAQPAVPPSTGRLLTDGREPVAPGAPPVEPAGDVPLERTPRPGASPTEAPEPAGGVPFVFTRAMTAELKARGYSDTAINRMTPAQAHDILSAPEDDDAAVAGVMGDLGVPRVPTEVPTTPSPVEVVRNPEIATPNNVPAPKTDAGTAIEPLGQPARVAGPESAQPGGYYLIHPTQLEADPKRLQFKADADEHGVTRAAKIDGPWNVNRAGIMLAWKDPENGKLYVVNGHHRLDAANRLNAPEILVKVLEPMSVESARLEGALTNIAEDKGTPIDAAKVIKGGGYSKEQLQQKAGINTRTKLARDGFALAQLSDPIFIQVATGEIEEPIGVAIGEAGLSPEAQQAVVKLTEAQRAKGREITPGVLRALIADVSDSSDVKAQSDQGNIFSDLLGEERTQNTAVEKATLRDWLSTTLAKDKRLFGYVSKGDRAARLAEGGNVLNTDKNKARADEAAKVQAVFTALAGKSGPISHALNDAAARIVQGEKDHVVKTDLLAAVRQAVEDEFRGSPSHGVATSAGLREGVRVGEEAHRPGGRETDGEGVTELGQTEDRLSTGEIQPRLPGDVGAVRDQEVAHPQLDDNLTSGYSRTALKNALHLTDDQATAVDALVQAMGLDPARTRFGYGEPSAEALSQYIGDKATLAPAARAGLDTAQKMAFFGEDPEKIRQATGWYVNPYDKKLRFELSDTKTAVTPAFNNLGVSFYASPRPPKLMLDDAFEHPDFYAAYPDLAKRLTIAKQRAPEFLGGDRIAGWYDPGEHRIYVSPDASDPRSIILHELQHAIQDHEGFARGGNMATAAAVAPEPVIRKQVDKLMDGVKKRREAAREGAALTRETIAALDNWAATLTTPQRVAVSPQALQTAPFDVRVEVMGHGSIDDARASLLKRLNAHHLADTRAADAERAFRSATMPQLREAVRQHSAMEVYKSIAGEIESRDVESRRNMTDDERAATEPYKAQNVAPEDAIYIGAKEGPKPELLYQTRHVGGLINPRPTPLDTDRPVIGIIDRHGTVQAKNSTPTFNDHDQLFGDKRPGAQRFRVNGDEVVWDDVPTADDYFAVEDYFARRGKLLATQRSYDVGSAALTPRRLNPKMLDGADTLFQGVKGSVEFTQAGDAIIRGAQSSDVSTALHEFAHVARRQLFDRNLPPEARAGVTDEDIRTAEQWAGAEHGRWTRDAEERFARGFERYVRDGQAPTAKLQSLFDKLAKWLTDIYRRITDALHGIEISPEMRRVFDRLVTRSERVAAEQAERERPVEVARPSMEMLRAQKDASERAVRKPKAQSLDFDDPSMLFQTDDGERPTEAQVRDLIKRVRGYLKEGLSKEDAAKAYVNDAPAGADMTRAFDAAWTRLAPKTPPHVPAGEEAPEYPPKRAANINLNKFEGISDEAREELKAIAEQHDNFMKQRRGVQTWDATEELAAAVPMPEKVGKPGKAMTAAQLDALGGYMDGLREQLDEVSVRVAAGDTTTETLAEQAKLLAQMQVVMETYAGGTAEAGRSLNILRKMRQKLYGADTDFMKQAVKFAGGKEHLQKIAKMLAMFPKGDRVGKYRFIRSLQKPGIADWLSWYWFTNLLSGPLTHARNTLGNLSSLSFAMAAKPASVAIDMARSAATNSPRSVRLGEIPHELAGLQRGFDDGIKKAAFLMKNGFTMENVASGEFRPPEVPGGMATNFIGRSMDAADLIAQSVRAMSELHAQTYTAARNAGHKPGTPAFNAFMDRWIANPSVDTMRAVKREALRTVFRQEPGFLTKLAAKMRGDIPVSLPSGRVVKLFNPMKLVIPFVTTPANIMRSSAEWTPLGFASAPFNKETPRERTEAAGRALTGTMLLAPLALLVAQGLVSGSGPQDKELRDQLYRTGWQPNSIKIGDKWYSYSNFQPMALPLSVMANAFESYEYTGHAPSVFEIAAKTADSVLQQSYLSGLAALQDALENPGARAQAFGEKMLTSAMPGSSLRGQVARAVDPVVRQPQSYTEALEAGDPFFSGNVRGRKDALGDQSERGGNILSRLFSPVTISEVKSSPLEDELLRLRNDVQVGFPSKTVTIRGNSVALTPDEYDQLLTESGQAIKTRLNDRVSDKGRWDRLSDEQKTAIVKDTIDTARAQVRSKIIRDVRARVASAARR